MDNVISEYQKWKKQGEQLRLQARQAMESRFQELLAEAAQIAVEYHRDFGSVLKPAGNITAFKYKSPGKKATKKGGKAPSASAPAPSVPVAVNPKVAGLQKQRAQVVKKLEAAKAAGKATKNLDDRLYEIDDELRLAVEAS
ncbi:MAG TPA: hypothetical protein VGL72_19460 [Bryobacteraceae bacterium]|jgi:hypothetical protein